MTNRELPVPDNCCAKETYAFAGMAFYWAQVLEQGAVNLAFVLRLESDRVASMHEFENLLEHLGTKTLGALLTEARKLVDIPSDADAEIADGLAARNYLCHKFFHDHAEDFVTEPGRNRMKLKLNGITEKLMVADERMEAIYSPLWARLGVTEESVREYMNALSARAEGA